MNEERWAKIERLLGTEGFNRAGAAAGNAVARPADAEQTAAVVRWAGEYGIRIRAVGQASPPAFSAGAMPLLRLDLGRMNRLRFYEPGDLTAGWDAGATAAEVRRTLAARGQFLPLDGGPEADTLGAILAAHRSGPLRHGFGTVRDFVIGIEAVTAAGQIIHGGGKVVKNVAGYDLMRMLIGSAGTLAIITGVNCKVFPALQATETVRFAVPAWPAAEQLRSRLLHAPLRLVSLELASGGGRPPRPTPLVALARFQGSEAVRARYRRELAAIGAELALAAEGVEPAEETGLWANWEMEPMPLRIGAPSGAAVELLRQTEALAGRDDRRLRIRGRLGLGVFGCALEPAPESDRRPDWNQRWRAMAARVHPDAWLRDSAEPWAAALTAGLAGETSHGWMRRLREHLDPTGLLQAAGAVEMRA